MLVTMFVLSLFIDISSDYNYYFTCNHLRKCAFLTASPNVDITFLAITHAWGHLRLVSEDTRSSHPSKNLQRAPGRPQLGRRALGLGEQEAKEENQFVTS